MKFYDDVYIGRDNYIARRVETLLTNVPMDLRPLTRCTLELVDSASSDTSYVVDSDTPGYDDVFDWETYGEQGLLGLRLGLVPDLPIGFHTFKLVVYSADFPNGLDDLKPIYFRIWDLSNG